MNGPIQLSAVIENRHDLHLRRVRTFGVAAFTACVAALFIGCASHVAYNMLSLFGGIGTFVSAVLGLGANWLAKKQEGVHTSGAGAITLADEAIVVERDDNHRIVIPRHDITSGWLEPGGFVHLAMRDSTEISFQPTTTDDPVRASAALLDALKLSERQHAAQFTIGSAGGMSSGTRFVHGLAKFGAFVTLACSVGLVARALANPERADTISMGVNATVAAAIFIATMLLVGRTVAKRKIHVGTDGVRTFGIGARFVPIGDIVGVEEQRDGAVLRLVDRREVFLPFDTSRDDLDRRSFVGRIRAVLSARDGGGGALTEDALEPGERTRDDWKSHLRGLVGGEGGYRRQRVEVADLERVLDDGAASPAQRVGAALALGSVGDPKTRERIRLAAAASTDDDLRAALEEAAEGELAEPTFARLARR